MVHGRTRAACLTIFGGRPLLFFLSLSASVSRELILTIASKALCRICHIHTQPCAAAVRKLQSQTMVAIMPTNIWLQLFNLFSCLLVDLLRGKSYWSVNRCQPRNTLPCLCDQPFKGYVGIDCRKPHPEKTVLCTHHEYSHSHCTHNTVNTKTVLCDQDLHCRMTRISEQTFWLTKCLDIRFSIVHIQTKSFND